MSKAVVTDYLNTQGLRLSVDLVQVAYMTLNAVYNVAEVESLPKDLWQDAAEEFSATAFLEQNLDHDRFLRQVYAVLDSTLSRYPAKVALYLKSDVAEGAVLGLQRVWHNQFTLSSDLNETEHAHLAIVRAAQTGWSQFIEHAQQWVHLGELTEQESKLGFSQMLLPLCAPTGVVLGVLYVTSPEANAFDEEAQSWWVAASLTLADALYQFFPSSRWSIEE